jgi:hypothetical protein
MLWYLLSKPEGWQAKMSILFEASSEKEHATRTIFKELEQSGYVQRIKHQDELSGRIEWDYIVFDTPQQAESTARHAEMAEASARAVGKPRPVAPLEPTAAPVRRGGVYDFSQGLPERVLQFLATPQCRWHWAEDLETFCFGREMGDPSAYMLGVIKRWIRNDGRPPDRERPTTTEKPRDPNAERRKKMLGKVP